MRTQPLPWQPAPMLDNPFLEEFFPSMQSKPTLAQFEAIPPYPVTCCLGEETDSPPPHYRLLSGSCREQ